MPFKQERKREKRKEREAEEEEKNLRRKLAIVQGVEKSKSSRAKVGSGSGSRKRKRSDSESSSDSETTLKTQVCRLTEKLKDMEASRKWNLKSNEIQYLHQVKVRQLWVEDFHDALEEHFGEKRKISSKLMAVVKKGFRGMLWISTKQIHYVMEIRMIKDGSRLSG